MRRYADNIRQFLARLSFRTGVIVACLCVAFYIISFAQMLLPLSVAAKGVLWTVFFGLAKAAQYSALLIFGKEGVSRVKKWFRSCG